MYNDLAGVASLRRVDGMVGTRGRFHRSTQISEGEAKALQSYLERQGIILQVGFLPKKELAHDRFLYSLDQSIKMPPFGGAYGDHLHVTEYTESKTEPSFFEQYWNRAVKL